MKNWRPSEIIAVVMLVAIIGFLAYVGINAKGDLGKVFNETK